ncbi:serine hydrolase domain-containing protein [Arthrobacter antibioticus]|uniref:serine hydrolase domain-containing protein n=1 Tax=Arthrobacter sp. H35-MC1 TaxID=3046203 RepID=UPI0024BB6203|nr:serine hydrolase domain-containing protein [Arthrobacter sp. H35-MC1]MDJ0317289.1 serine hydrolase domain-containing protein [Arthrobacter sp. H35-MC1]
MPATHRILETKIQKLLNQCVQDRIAPAASCAVVLHHDWLPELIAGEASPQTFFDLASVTKLFTTVTALSLVDSKALELDAPIGRILPTYRQGQKATVTLRQLLTHTSGLPSQWRGWERSLNEGRGFERARLVQDLLDTALEAPPGTRFEYSCAGFNTIMVLAEHATGQPWAALVHDRVLAKLPTSGLTGTPRVEHCAPTEYQHALGRGLIQGIVHDEAAWSLGGLSGNAGMFATSGGLVAFGESLGRGLPGILSPGLAEEMWRSQLPEILGNNFNPEDPASGHSLGMRINAQTWMGSHAQEARGHGGFTGTSLLIDREHSLSIALLTNRVSPSRDGDDATNLRKAVSDVVYSGENNPR